MIFLLINSNWQKLKTTAAEILPIRYVRVGGAFQYIAKEKIKSAIQPLLAESFFSLDMQTIRAAVEALPWVDSAGVKRIWPDTIEIKIYEQQPVARWLNHQLINKRGESFQPANVEGFEALPQLLGSVDQERKVFIFMLKLQDGLRNNNLVLAEIKVSERRSWRIKLVKGITVQLGRKQPFKNFQRFIKVLPVLGKDRTEMIKTVDMRYPNGFSITWKPGAVLEWNKAPDVSKNNKL